jgi:uncharacterized protein (DUF885 family)
LLKSSSFHDGDPLDRLGYPREAAKARLGPGFDLRDFNDAVVSTGGGPLTVLAEVVDRYVATAPA